MKTSLLFRPLGLTLLLVLCFATLFTRAASPVYAEDPVGIQFFKGSWSAVLAEAKKQNKPVFVDIYTTWCGPCKLMAKQAFPDQKVGEKFNANFISYQIDAEKGEGIDVAKKYAVTAYPTSLYVSGDGELLHRAVGYGGIPGMLTEADKAIAAAKDPTPVSVMDKQFVDGKRDADFLRTYLAKRAQLGMPSGEALEAFLTAVPQAEWTSPANIDAVAGNLTTANSRAFEPLLNEVKAIRLDRARMKTAQAIMQAVSQAVGRDERQAKTEAELETAIANTLKLRTTLSPKAISDADRLTMANDSRMGFYQRTKNMPKYRGLATASAAKLMAISTDSLRARDAATYQRFMDEAKNVPDSVKASPNFTRYATMMKTIETQQVSNKLNSLAWAYFQNMTDPADLKQALTWSTRMVALDPKPALLDTHAQLLNKLGRKAEAAVVEQDALTKAKAAGEDTAEYEKALAEMQKK
jgi:thiol-disulfide isomerase/thioredoxin